MNYFHLFVRFYLTFPLKYGIIVYKVGRLYMRIYKSDMASRKLTGKQQLFVEHFTNPKSPGFRNGSESVRLAGYGGKPEHANRISTQLMNHPTIKPIVDKIMAERAEKNELTAEYVLAKLVDLVENTDKDADRIRTLELLGKSLGLFRDRQEISGPNGDAIQMEQKVKQNADDFASRIASLAKRNGTTGVAEFPHPAGDGGA